MLLGTGSLVKNPASGEARILLRDYRTGRIVGNYNLADVRIDALNLEEQPH